MQPSVKTTNRPPFGMRARYPKRVYSHVNEIKQSADVMGSSNGTASRSASIQIENNISDSLSTASQSQFNPNNIMDVVKLQPSVSKTSNNTSKRNTLNILRPLHRNPDQRRAPPSGHPRGCNCA